MSNFIDNVNKKSQSNKTRRFHDYKSPKAVFYGAGEHGVAACNSCLNFGFNVVAFCDSNKTGNIDVVVHGNTITLPIISPEKLKSEYSDAFVVVSVKNPMFEKEIIQKLMNIGIKEELILNYDDYKISHSDLYIKEMSGFSDSFLSGHLKGYEWSYNFFEDNISKNVIVNIACLRQGVKVDNIHTGGKQYFDLSINGYEFTEDEVVVDCGYFTGDTAQNFIRSVNNRFKKYYGFEISKYNLSRQKDYIVSDKRIVVVKKGCWSYATEFFASLDIDSSSRICNAETQRGAEGTTLSVVQTISLDSFFSTEPDIPTLIKMDIEGAELHALLGAKNIIQKHKPKLAISAYHKPEDIYELPRLIKELNPNYKFALRHYTNGLFETVLYAY
ncbi:hypothetical protein OXPF_17610 [Oxobacter pfennigii]|uniref:Methyltransferase FkbM domain-containing protein n=1 Tax=Oxobacter pfennigii TaxID=36849 RepID=A0A0P8W9M0_9CLOT|nr:FkbM family methyltransferase [Oxobacter pfennigii]KPU44675.1 hypothetical protein OXPF_17610 [Oxobacter pfennigii]